MDRRPPERKSTETVTDSKQETWDQDPHLLTTVDVGTVARRDVGYAGRARLPRRRCHRLQLFEQPLAHYLSESEKTGTHQQKGAGLRGYVDVCCHIDVEVH
jgi:hypothetical protein